MSVPSKNNTEFDFAICQRQEGNDFLSWIEKFCLYLFEKGKISFDKEGDETLVFRINKKSNIISAYHCFFKNDSNGFTKFYVNKEVVTEDASQLKQLMEDAKWDDESTKNWWNEVFRGGNKPVDEDTLKRPEVLAYANAKMVMIDFIEQIKKEFENVVNQLAIDNAKFSKVLIVEQYAKALPVQYSLRRIFPNAKYVSGEIFKEWEKDYSWFKKADRFYIPEELLQIELNTSTKMNIDDVVKLDGKGIVVTLPLSSAEQGLPSTPVFKGPDLKWNELMKGDVQYDYKAGNLLFKRVQLSMIADVFRTLYVKCDSHVVACSEYENGKYQIKSFSLNKSEEVQKATVSKFQQDKMGYRGKLTSQTGDKNGNDILMGIHK